MHRFRYVFTLLGAIVFCSCERKDDTSPGYFDSLITSNIDHLVKSKARVHKYSVMDGKKDTISFQPDSIMWIKELDVFRPLSAFQKPAFRDDYEVADGVKDSLSNLTVRQYKSRKAVTIPLIRFYYYQQFNRLKKIEAHYHADNTLYSATRHLTMEFEEHHGAALLSRYTIDGIQRMILSDSITYSIRSGITF